MNVLEEGNSTRATVQHPARRSICVKSLYGHVDGRRFSKVTAEESLETKSPRGPPCRDEGEQTLLKLLSGFQR